MENNELKINVLERQTFYNIGKMIERDSKSTTYKFALLRGVIDVIQENSPYISIKNDLVEIPFGLLIEKWLIYYYPIFESELNIPQINGNNNLSFQTLLEDLIQFYKNRGGFSAFYNDLRNKRIPESYQKEFYKLVKKLKQTISGMPMKHIGRSFNQEYYSIFQNQQSSQRSSSVKDILCLINNFGTFSIPIQYYEAFKIIGSFINGQDSILFNWAEFSVRATKDNLSIESVLKDVLKSPITERNISQSKTFYKKVLKNHGSVTCVWTGKKIYKYDIDHVIPFSIWKNNDLWNLLPSTSTINKHKRDKIPSPDFIETRKDIILDYWEVIYESSEERFQKEIQKALLGYNSSESWREKGISQLKESCDYLIETRGYESWSI